MDDAPALDGLDHVALRVRDLEASAAWYERVLGLRRAFADAWGPVPVVLLTPGGSRSGVALFPARADAGGPGLRGDVAVDHFAFRTTRAGFEAAMARLEAMGIPFDVQDHVVCESLYVADPDGHRVEVTTYEMAGRGG